MLPVWGGLYLKGPIQGGAYFRNFTVAFRSATKSYLVLYEHQRSGGGRHKSFTHIEHRTGAVSR